MQHIKNQREGGFHQPRENASETSQLCLNTFNAIATCTGTHRYDIDLANKVTLRQAAEGRAKLIAPLDLIFFVLGVSA